MEFDEYESLPTGNALTHMLAGAAAGVMEHCVMYPLDSVKVSSWFTYVIENEIFFTIWLFLFA